jgi:hypothetical protein
VDGRNSGQRQCFNYDGLNRLLRGFTGNSTCLAYDNTTGNGVFDESNAFNNAGNLVSKTGLGTYSYGAQAASCPQGALSKPHAVVAAGSNAYCYDQNGNMVRRTIGGSVYTLTYDAENRLASISGAATASFSYDGDGNRVKSVLNGETVIYVGNLYEKKVVGSTTTHTKYYYFGGRRIAIRVAGTLSWLLGDHLVPVQGTYSVNLPGSERARHRTTSLHRHWAARPSPRMAPPVLVWRSCGTSRGVSHAGRRSARRRRSGASPGRCWTAWRVGCTSTTPGTTIRCWGGSRRRIPSCRNREIRRR